MSDGLILGIVSAVASVISAAIAAWVSVKVGKVGTRIDGRMDELLAINKESSRAKGNLEGRSEQTIENKHKKAR